MNTIHSLFRSARILFLLPGLLAFAFSFGCKQRNSHDADSKICIGGSSILTPVLENWNSTFSGDSTITLELTGNGTVPGVLRERHCDLGVTTRKLSDREIHSIVKTSGSPPLIIPIAREAMVITISGDFPANSAGKKTIHDIFTSADLDFNSIFPDRMPGTSNNTIHLFGVDSASDEYRWFKESILDGDDFTDLVVELKSTDDLIEKINEESPSIGYAPYRKLKNHPPGAGKNSNRAGIKGLAIKTENGRTITPEEKNFRSGSYPFMRYIYIYLRHDGGDKKIVRNYIHHILSNEAQESLLEHGFFPILETDRIDALRNLSQL